MAKSTYTWHFRVLRGAGVVAQRDEDTRRLNRLRPDDRAAGCPGLLDLVPTEARRSGLVAATSPEEEEG